MKHFITLADLSSQEFKGLIDSAIKLKRESCEKGSNKPLLKNKSLGMIFQKPSLRTRVSFEAAMWQLGGNALSLSENEIKLGARESASDIARVLSRYVDVIAARVFSHGDIIELAKYSSVPVINMLSDYSHPCQGAGDLLTIAERFGKVKGLKVVFVGDGNNVAASLAFGCALLGIDFICCSPKGFELNAAVFKKAKALCSKTGGSVALSNNPKEAVKGADVIYTDIWVSMGQKKTKRQLEIFASNFQVNRKLLSYAAPHYIVMHCLPAHRGSEITSEVCDDKKHSAIWDQAENRLHIQKAILVKLLEK